MNRGAAAGASLAHPHAQLIGTPVVPPLLAHELHAFKRHRERHGGCLLCEELTGARERLILAGPIAVWAPAAPRLPGEIWMAPAEHAADVREANPAPLAAALRRTLATLKKVTDDAPLNLWIHTAPAEGPMSFTGTWRSCPGGPRWPASSWRARCCCSRPPRRRRRGP